MPRRPRHWLANKTGKRPGLPGYYVLWNTYDADGRQRRHSRHFLDAKHARTWCRQMNIARETRDVQGITTTTVRAAAVEFLGTLHARAAGTQRQYAASFTLFAVSVGAETPIHSLNGRSVDQFIGQRLEEHSESTAAKHIRHLRRLFRWCIRVGYMAHNPIDAAGALPRPRVRTKPRITEDQFGKLLAACTTEQRVAVLLAATTGLDRGTIARLTPGDIDLDRHQVRVVRPKTGAHIVAPLHRQVSSQLSKVLAQNTGHLVFAGVWHRSWWKRAAEAAGLPELTFRDLRTFAANWLRGAVGDFEAQHILGHSTPTVTSRHYYQSQPTTQLAVSKLPLPGSVGQKPRGKPQKRGKRRRREPS